MQRNIISTKEIQEQLNQLLKDENVIGTIGLMDLKTVNLLLAYMPKKLEQLKIFYDLALKSYSLDNSKDGRDYRDTHVSIMRDTHWILALYGYEKTEYSRGDGPYSYCMWPKYFNTILLLLDKIENVTLQVTQQKEYLLKKIENENYLEKSLADKKEEGLEQKEISEKMTTASERVAFEVLQNHDVLMEKLRQLSKEKDDDKTEMEEKIKSLELSLQEKTNHSREQKEIIETMSHQYETLKIANAQLADTLNQKEKDPKRKRGLF